MQTEKWRVTQGYARWFERSSGLFLLLAVVPGFLIDQPPTIVKMYHVLVMLPMLVYCLCKPSVLFKSGQTIAARLFLLFTVYSLLTMAWSVDGAAPIELCWNVLSTYILFILVFLVSQEPHHLLRMEKAFLIGGTVCLALSYFAADRHVGIINLNAGYGVFTHHVYVSWLAGSLSLLLLARQPRLSFIDTMFFCAYFSTMIFSHGRGGLIVFTAGYLCLMFRQHHPLRDKQVVLCVVIVLCLIYLFFPFHLEKFIDKGLNMRPEIWQHGYHKVTRNAVSLWCGAGLNASDNFSLHGFLIPHFHSLYWSQLYYGGVVGLCLYLALLVTVLRHGFRQSALSPWWYLLIGMSAALIVDGDQFFMSPSPLFICFLLPFFITLFTRHDKPREMPAHE